MSSSNPTSISLIRPLRHIGDYDRVTNYTPLITKQNSSLRNHCPTLHQWRLQSPQAQGQTVYTDDDQVHVTLSPSIGGRGTTLPEISEMTIHLRDLNKYKSDASTHLKASGKPIDLSDYSQVPREITQDSCPITAYRRAQYPLRDLREGVKHEGTFSIYSGEATITGRHKSLFGWYSAIMDTLHGELVKKRIPQVSKECNVRYARPPGEDVTLGLTSSGVTVNLSVYDQEGREHNKDVTMKVSGLSKFSSRLPSKDNRASEVFSWTTTPLMAGKECLIWNEPCRSAER